MPFEITSKTFADEFNTGTTNNLVNAVAGDLWTATIDVDWSNIIDAGDPNDPNSSSYKWTSLASGSLQAFETNLDLSSANSSNLLELFNGNFIGATIDASGFNGSINGTYTINSIGTTSNGYLIVCNETFTSSLNANNGRIAVTEAITSANIDYRVNGSQNDDYDLAISVSPSSNKVGNFSTTTAVLDATVTGSPISIPFKYNGAYQTGSLTIDGAGITNDVQSFQIVHTFKVTPISLYDDGTRSQPSNTGGTGYSGINQSLYDTTAFFGIDGIGKAGILPTFSNQIAGGFEATQEINYNTVPNVNIRTFGSSYIGNDTNYSISNLSIVRTSDSYVTDKPIVNEKFTVSFDVDNTVDTPFSNSNTLVKVGIENLPLSIDNSLDYEQAFLSDYAIELLGAAAGTGNATGDALSISNYTATFNSTSQISVSFDVDFTANAQTQILLDNDLYFSIYCVPQDHTKNYTDSDRTILSVFSGRGIETVLEDPINVVDTQFITAPYDDYSTGINASDIDGFPVQLLVGTSRFYADWTNRDNLRIDTIEQKLVLKNTSTLEEIELDGTKIPVNAFTLIDSKYPDANYNVQKGFNIPNNEIRNRIRLINKPNLDFADTHYFDVAFPFFIRWEYYKELVLNAVPSSILDTNEPFDGKNYFVHRIDDIANWQLDYRITFNCSEGSTTFEQDFDYTISTTDYDSHTDVISRSIKTYSDSGFTTLQPTISGSGLQVIDSEENTYLKVEFELNYTPSAITDFEIEIYAEVFENGSPTRIQRISSINGLAGNSPFTDTGAGDGLVLKSIDGDKAVGVCVIDVDKLAKFDKYRVYATFYDPKRPTEYLLAENGDNLVSENGDKLIRDF